MFLKKIYNKKTSRTFLTIVKGYRDENGKSKSKTIKSIGYLDEFETEFSDPIAHFTEVAKQLTLDEKEEQFETIHINKNDTLSINTNNRYNLGYAVLSNIFHELRLDEFFKNKQRNHSLSYNTYNIAQHLVYSRILLPSSKHASYINRDFFFENTKFSLDNVYQSLSYFTNLNQDMLSWTNREISKLYNRDTSVIYYDVTNYYFESDAIEGLKKKGYSKENKKSPIIQMGLAIDNNGLPITYELYEGNTHDSQTYAPIIDKLKNQYSDTKITVVADKGLNTGDNITLNMLENDCYIFGQSIRGASQDLKDFVLKQDDYIITYNTDNINSPQMSSKIKERIVEDHIIHVSIPGKKNKKKIKVAQRQIVFFSKKYADRAARKREEVINKAKDLIANPSKYTVTTTKGTASYINNLTVDDNGEIVTNKNRKLSLNMDKFEEEAKYDGYYTIATNDMDRSETEIIKTYHGLWKIEESFKVTKTDIKTRPIYLKREDRIRAHFMFCYLSLLILRILQYKLKDEYSCGALINDLNSLSCSKLNSNLYVFDYYSEISDKISKEFNIDFNKKFRTKAEIKKILSNVKTQHKNE